MKNHYNAEYYRWQKKSGELGALIDLWKFAPFIKKGQTVLDYGCGGGYILAQLPGKKKYGVDINKTALRQAQKQGIITATSLKQLPEKLLFDVIISHHTLEHLENPAQILKELRTRLKKNGIAIHILPINDWRNDKSYNPRDINKHLYTWTPLLLGNLFVHCGYKIKEISILTHAWLPLSKYTYRILPKPLYHLGCMIWSFITRNRQIRIIATS